MRRLARLLAFFVNLASTFTGELETLQLCTHCGGMMIDLEPGILICPSVWTRVAFDELDGRLWA